MQYLLYSPSTQFQLLYCNQKGIDDTFYVLHGHPIDHDIHIKVNNKPRNISNNLNSILISLVLKLSLVLIVI